MKRTTKLRSQQIKWKKKDKKLEEKEKKILSQTK